MGTWVEAWIIAGFALYLSGAAVAAFGAIWIASRGDKDRPDRNAVVAALAVTSMWCVMVAAFGPKSPVAGIAEVVRNLGWILVVYRLFANDGRHQTLAPIRPVVMALAFVEALQIVLIVVEMRFAVTDELKALVFQVCVMFRLLVAVGVLVLLHNLYVGASQSVRPILRWTAAALAAMWAFDLNFFTVAYLGGELPLELVTARGLVIASMVIPLAIGSKRSAVSIRPRRPSCRPGSSTSTPEGSPSGTMPVIATAAPRRPRAWSSRRSASRARKASRYRSSS